MEKIENEVIDGKPHFGHWYEAYTELTNKDNSEEDVLKLVKYVEEYAPHLETRYTKIVMKDEIISIKFLLWGRAYEIMRLVPPGVKRYKKIRCDGRWKRKR